MSRPDQPFIIPFFRCKSSFLIVTLALIGAAVAIAVSQSLPKTTRDLTRTTFAGGATATNTPTLTPTACGAPGALDSSFGGTGIVSTQIDPLVAAKANAMAIQPDGKIVTAGVAYDPQAAANRTVLARFNPDGALDNSFGSNGIVIANFGSGSDWANAVAIQPDGKIVMAGVVSNSSGNFFALARFDPNGSDDGTFGVKGKVITQVGGAGFDNAYSVAIQSDGKIVETGFVRTDRDNFGLVRLNADGSLDTSFGTGGKVITPVGNSLSRAYSTAIQSDGKIAVGGTAYGSQLNGRDFALARYNSDGTLDTSFDGDGISITGSGFYHDEVRSIGIQPDGKIVAAGFSTCVTCTFGGGFRLARYNTDGALDTSFGGGAVSTTFGPLPHYDVAYRVAVQNDGKIVAAGKAYRSGPYDFGLVRYNTDGSLDTSFDGDGKVLTPYGSGDESANAIAIQPDGKIVAAGYSQFGFTVARYFDQNLCPFSPTPTSTATFTPTATDTATPTPTATGTSPPQTWSNLTPICTTLGSPAELYPSTVTVSGVNNPIGSLRVLLYGITHQVPDNLDVLLVGPNGEKYILMADAGGAAPIGEPGIDLTFSDSAGQVLPDSTAGVTGLYEPTSWELGQSSFLSPAPPGPYNEPGSEVGGTGVQTINGNFGGINANGVWSLYVRDDGGSFDGTGGPTGCMDRGWQLQFLPMIFASISGRVTNANGQGIRGAKIVVTNPRLPEPLIATTGSFGYYSFEGLENHDVYVLTVSSGRYTFNTPSRVINLTQNVTDADFIADP